LSFFHVRATPRYPAPARANSRPTPGEDALSRVLFDVSPGDLGATLSASLVLLAAALVACVPPALRAMRVDPVEGLRAE
jgi:ABC-type lipoprotein release transport system permease subunit